MLSLLLLMLFGLAIAFFAGQNTYPVTIELGNYRAAGIPLYVVIVGSLILGFFVSWIVSLIDAAFNLFALRGKDNAIRNTQRRANELEERVHDLEVENAQLRGERHEPQRTMRDEEEDRDYRPSFFERLKHSFR